MEFKLTQSDAESFVADGYIDIKIGNYRIYLELDQYDKKFWYFELTKSMNGKTLQKYAHDVTELDKLNPRRTNDPSYWHNDPLCPNCQTYMIYQFEHCPKCGQKLDWSEA